MDWVQRRITVARPEWTQQEGRLAAGTFLSELQVLACSPSGSQESTSTHGGGKRVEQRCDETKKTYRASKSLFVRRPF